jgi:hypothetical protein
MTFATQTKTVLDLIALLAYPSGEGRMAGHTRIADHRRSNVRT